GFAILVNYIFHLRTAGSRGFSASVVEIDLALRDLTLTPSVLLSHAEFTCPIRVLIRDLSDLRLFVLRIEFIGGGLPVGCLVRVFVGELFEKLWASSLIELLFA